VIKKLILHNFMSHSHSEIELSGGLTVLNGPNNCGKSAIVAAFDVLCNNLSGDFMVRHGAKECYVTVELDDENVVTWRRKGRVTNYEINGREVHRLGRGGVPDDLHQILRMPQIQHPGRQSDPFEIHLAHQKAPIFLLDQPGSRAAMFFASSSDAEKLLRMQQRHRRKVRDARQTLNQKRVDVGALATKRDILQPIGEIDALANRSLTEERALAEIAQKRELATQLLMSLGRAATRREHVASEVKSLQPLATPPKLHNTGALHALITQTAQALDRLDRTASVERAFARLAPPPPLANTRSLSVLVTSLADTWRRAEVLQVKATTLLGLRILPQLEDAAVLKRFVEQIETAAKRVKHDRWLTQSLAALTRPPTWQAGEPLQQSFSKLQRAEDLAKKVQRHAQIMAGLCEPPVLSEQAALARTIQKMEVAFDEISRLSEASDQLEQLILVAAESMSLVDPRADAEAVASKRYSGILRYAAITATILLLFGAGIWVAYTLRMPPELPLSDVPNGQLPRDLLNDRAAVAFMPPGNVNVSASNGSSKNIPDSEIDASQKEGFETAAIWPSAGVSDLHAPVTIPAVLDPDAPPEVKILALESERNILRNTVQKLETAVEASQAQLSDARMRLAMVEHDLSALHASMQLERGPQP